MSGSYPDEQDRDAARGRAFKALGEAHEDWGNSIRAEDRDGYRGTIALGIAGARKMSGRMTRGSGTFAERIAVLRERLAEADAVVIGAGAGLSTSAGFTYSGERFEAYFADFSRAFGFRDMYSGGFYPFPDDETRWAFWARNIYINRYVDPPEPVYRELLGLVKDRDHFVITTNVDHQFQRAGFAKERLFYTQGDYGLFQSTDPSARETWDNEAWVLRAMEAQGFVRDAGGVFRAPAGGFGPADGSPDGAPAVSMRIPEELIPTAPDGGPVTMNLRADDTFVEDAGWHRASASYADYLAAHEGKKILFLELGVGANTPVIIKYPFWAMTLENDNTCYACINRGQAFCPAEIADRSVCIDGDIGEVLELLG